MHIVIAVFRTGPQNQCGIQNTVGTECFQVISLNKLSSNLCYTECGDGGCRCVKNASSVVDQLYVTSTVGDVLSCICGDFQVKPRFQMTLTINTYTRGMVFGLLSIVFFKTVKPEQQKCIVCEMSRFHLY